MKWNKMKMTLMKWKDIESYGMKRNELKSNWNEMKFEFKKKITPKQQGKSKRKKMRWLWEKERKGFEKKVVRSPYAPPLKHSFFKLDRTSSYVLSRHPTLTSGVTSPPPHINGSKLRQRRNGLVVYLWTGRSCDEKLSLRCRGGCCDHLIN